MRKAARRYQAMSSSYDTIAHTVNQPTGAAASAIVRQSSPILGSGVSSDSSQSSEDAEEVGEVLLDEVKWLSGSVLVAGCSPTNWEGAIFFTCPASVDSESSVSAAELQDVMHSIWNGYTSEQMHRVRLTRSICSVRGEGDGEEDGGGVGSGGASNSRKLNMWREAVREREHQRLLQRGKITDKAQLPDETGESRVADVSHAVSDPRSQPSHITSVAAASSESVPKLSRHAVMSDLVSQGYTTSKTTKSLVRIKTFSQPLVSSRPLLHGRVLSRQHPPSARPPTMHTQ